MSKVKIGMVQMEVVFSEPEINLKTAERLVREAKKQGAEICLLPECLDLGWANPDAVFLAEPIPGNTSDFFCRIARENDVFIVAGLTEKDGDRVYNTALLISNTGEILFKHRKINVLTGVEDIYSVGNVIGVTETKFGTLAIDICADNQQNSLSIGVTMARMGAQIILSPSAWAVTPDRDATENAYGMEWHTPYKKLSTIFGIPVIGVSNVGHVSKGVWAGWKAIGNSIAYNSDGSLITVLPYGENAESIKVVEVSIVNRELSGTSLSESIEAVW